MMATTIKDVAKQAGVSVATVSRYINSKGYISEEAQCLIKLAIEELNYKPNQIARSLSKKQMTIIGLIVPDITNPFFPQLARAIEDTALKRGYTVILCNSDEQAAKEQQYIDSLQQSYIAGFIIATNQLNERTYKQLNVPVVLLDRGQGSEILSVITNNHIGAKIGTEYLLQCGATQIACISGPSHLEPAKERVAGFLQAMQGQERQAIIVESPFHFEDAERIAKQLLTEHPEIDGIFASSDIMAIGVMKAAAKLGIQMPEQLQLVGFDGISLGEMVTPSLTTVAQNIYKLGETATMMLLDQIEGHEVITQNVEIQPQLIVRHTTKEIK